MCSVSPRLASLQDINHMISRSPWMKDPPHPSVPFTPCPRRNLQLFVISLKRTSLQGSFIPLTPHVEPQSFSSIKTMARFGFVSTSEALTEYPKRIATHSC